MAKFSLPNTQDWKALSRNDWGDILELSRKKTFQRKFQIAEAFTKIMAEKGYHQTTHAEIAKSCHVTRQLVDHHFPTDRALLMLTYRYIYARFQKYAADAVMSRQGALSQFQAYVHAMPAWVRDHRADARFLTQYYAISPVYPELFAFHERNTLMGQQRIYSMLVKLRDEKTIHKTTDEKLLEYASSIQQQIIGYIVLYSGRKALSVPATKARAEELWRSCFAIATGS